MNESKHSTMRINPETHKLIGKIQLQQYGLFSDTYNKRIVQFKNKLSEETSNVHRVHDDFITIEPSCEENITVLNLVNSDNKLLSKMLASLASICFEMGLIVKESEELQNEFLYYEGIVNEDKPRKPTSCFVKKVFGSLQKTLALVDRSQQVSNLLLQQLNSLVGKGYYASNNGSNFTENIDHLAKLLVSLLVLEYVFDSPVTRQHCSHYLMISRNILLDPHKFSFSRENLEFLVNNIESIETKLLKGSIFKNVVQYCASNSTTSPGVSAEFTAHINHLITEIEHDEDHIFFTNLWLQLNTLVAFQWSIFGDVDKRMMKKITELNKKIGSCTIAGCKLWYPEEFLSTHIPSIIKLINPQSLNNSRLNQLTFKTQNLVKETSSLCSSASLALTNIERVTKQNMTRIDIKDIQDATTVFIEAIKLVRKINELVKWILIIHADKNLPISKTTLLAICRLIEILKSFQFTLNKSFFEIVYLIMMISQHLTHKTLTMIYNLRKNIAQEKSYKQKQLDELSSLSVCEQSMKGPNTRERFLIAKLALSASGIPKNITQDIKNVINRLELFNSYHLFFKEICDCSFLFQHSQSLIPTYFSKLIGNSADLTRFYLLMSAFNDCALINETTLTHLQDGLRQHFLEPLFQSIENNLRLQTHLHLALPPSDPFKSYLSLNFNSIRVSKLRDIYWSVLNETEHYLSTMFYNLTTVVLHDWQTYGEMRRLAHLQYNLETVEDNLPTQTIEQGLDVLEIMRNINVFVSKYLYNLNSQVFVEEKSNNKHLNTIGISHVANSIRTHGIGIMNTTVNFTYQFLQKKFFIFSQFMYDEQIKSRLLKDLKHFSEHKHELNQMYPYERAEKFNYGIKKLGLNENGLSCLDLFRKLISQIGNAMGYVRLIRSGGRRCLANGTCFIPDFRKTENISEYFSEDNIPHLTQKAALFLKHDLKNLVDNFEEATEYFKLLVDVFVPIFRDPKHIHLKNFYVIVPPLTINFIEHSLTCKERLNKKDKNEASFTDDGFAMGLAFIIELLEQEDQVNSLHWFHSVRNKFFQERKSVQNQTSKESKNDNKLQQTLRLTERRINMYEKEFQLLYYNYRSARIFFQT